MYKLLTKTFGTLETQMVTRTSDNASIPMNLANSDYQAYLRWLDGYELIGEDWVKTAESNTPELAEEPV
jgi:hypothetical protein